MKKIIALLILSFVMLFLIKNSCTKKLDTIGSMEVYSSSDLENLSPDKCYTYEEMIEDKLRSGIIEKTEAERLIENNLKSSSNATILYSKIRMEKDVFSHGLSKYILEPIFYVGLDYTENSISPDRIVSVENPHINTRGGSSCIFGGNIFYALESGNSLYYGVYGDVWKTGNTTISDGEKVGIGDSATLRLNFTYSNNFIKNIDFDGRFYSSNMSR